MERALLEQKPLVALMLATAVGAVCMVVLVILGRVEWAVAVPMIGLAGLGWYFGLVAPILQTPPRPNQSQRFRNFQGAAVFLTRVALILTQVLFLSSVARLVFFR